MAGLDLIALTDAKTGQAVERVKKLDGQKIRVVEAYGLAAVFAPARLSASLPPLGRKAIIKRLSRAQKRLEAMLPLGPLLAVRGDTWLRDETDALGLLASHEDTIREAVTVFGPKVQFQITIRWADAAQAGDALKTDLAARFAALLSDAAEDTLRLPVDDDETLLNMAVMIARPDEPKLDRAVEAIDAAMSGELTIRYLGPLPALSFAALTVRQPKDDALAEARTLIGVGDTVSRDDLRARYLDLMRAHHPDSADMADAVGAPDEHATNDRLTAIKDAYTLLCDVEAARAKSASRRPILAAITADTDRRAA